MCPISNLNTVLPFQYLELRFKSKAIRLLGTALGTISYVMYFYSSFIRKTTQVIISSFITILCTNWIDLVLASFKKRISTRNLAMLNNYLNSGRALKMFLYIKLLLPFFECEVHFVIDESVL